MKLTEDLLITLDVNKAKEQIKEKINEMIKNDNNMNGNVFVHLKELVKKKESEITSRSRLKLSINRVQRSIADIARSAVETKNELKKTSVSTADIARSAVETKNELKKLP